MAGAAWVLPCGQKSKVGDGDRPLKFPLPDGSHWTMLIVDLRALGQIDRYDCRQIAYGVDAVPEGLKYRWIADNGREYPIIGAFDKKNQMNGAKHFRERVHFLGLVAEESYERDELQYFMRFYQNKALFPSEEEARETLSSFPLFQPKKTRERVPEFFLHEVFEQISDDVIRFGIVIDRKTVLCHVHRDTLEELEQGGLTSSSDGMLQAYYRHDARLRRLAVEMLKRDLVGNDGIIFVRPTDLKLLSQQVDERRREEDRLS